MTGLAKKFYVELKKDARPCGVVKEEQD
jgi:hypothetical protein